MAKKLVCTVTKQRFEKYQVFFPQDWEITYLDVPYTDEELIAAIGDKEYLFVGAVHPVSANVINACPNLKFIQSEGVAFDKIDVKAAKEKGIWVSNNRGANAGGVAEHTIALMLAAYRRIALHDKRLRKEDFALVKGESLAMGIHELGGKHIGFVGMGAIAKEVVKRLSGWNVKISYYDTFRPTPEEEKALGIEFMEFDELCKACDVISMHVPVFPETVGMLGEKQFDEMKDTAIVVNTARGEVINDEALAKALEEGKIAHAALDVMVPEPTPKDHILMNMSKAGMDRLTVTPHIGGMTDEAFITMLTGSISNFEAMESGCEPKNIVNR